MATIKEQVASVITLIADNNPRGVTSELRRMGFQTSYDIIPSAQVQVALHELYLADKAKFYNLLQNVNWDSSNLNYTNDPANRDIILSALGINTSVARVDFNGAWHNLLNILQGTDTSTTTTESGTPAGVYIAFAGVIIALIVIIVIVFKKK